MTLLAEILGQLLLGWLLADFVTGVFHWWEDIFGREEWPVVGPWIVTPNRLHHTDPLAFTRHGFAERNRAAIIASGLAAAALALLFGPALWIAALAVGSGLSNEVHRYAHQPSRSPKWLAVLQQIGIVQSGKGHAPHHRPPQDVNFCILSDWLNPVFEAVGFWRALERLCGGIAQ